MRNSYLVLFNIYYQSDKAKEDGVVPKCTTDEQMKMHKIILGKYGGRDNLGDLGLKGWNYNKINLRALDCEDMNLI